MPLKAKSLQIPILKTVNRRKTKFDDNLVQSEQQSKIGDIVSTTESVEDNSNSNVNVLLEEAADDVTTKRSSHSSSESNGQSWEELEVAGAETYTPGEN